jgi:RNA polymerase sigma-70 factor (ECF subfamily)
MRVAASSTVEPREARPTVEAAWLELRERLRAFVARRISNREDVEDTVQWVFLQMHKRLGQIRDGERIPAWLYSTARRAIADYYRSGRRREVAAGDASDLEDLHQGGELLDDDAPREVATCLAPVVGRLSAVDREVIQLTELEGHGMAETAARLGISVSGMKSRAQRARRRFREALLHCCHVALDGRGAPVRCAKREPVAGSYCPTGANSHA